MGGDVLVDTGAILALFGQMTASTISARNRFSNCVFWWLLRGGAYGTFSDALTFYYWGRPADFADATLVYLVERESLTTIFTVDSADFETYCIEGQRRSRILPAGRP